jgi:hypothetical protein
MKMLDGWTDRTRPLLAAVVVLALAGCGKGDDPKVPAPPAGGGKRQVESNGGAYAVSLQTSPDPVPMNQPFSVSFTVAPKSPGADFTVEVDARMPAHGHGMNVAPKLTRAPDGSYRADGMLFHMPGHWEMYVDITRAGRSERAQVDIDLK